MCFYIKTMKGYRTKDYLQIGLPNVSVIVSGLNPAMTFAYLNSSEKVKLS